MHEGTRFAKMSTLTFLDGLSVIFGQLQVSIPTISSTRAAAVGRL